MARGTILVLRALSTWRIDFTDAGLVVWVE
jgi:hypothetical protein